MRKLFSITLYFICFVSYLVFSSCSNNKKSNELIREMDEALISSNKIIDLSTQQILRELKNKTTEPATMEIAKVWLQKAEQITVLTSELYTLLEANKKNLINGKVNFDYFEDQLYKYKQNILNVDSTIRLEFEDNNEFKNKTSSTISSLERLTFLQNNIKIIENKITAYCNTKVTNPAFIFDYYRAIIFQNSTTVKAGEELKIDAGIGAYSWSTNPEIIINGNKINLNEGGIAVYKIKAQNKPGDYIIPIRISYYNQTTAKNEFYNGQVKYTVVKPCDQ